jgi:uncharacterized protein
MNYPDIITQTRDFVKRELQSAEGGHDWWHALRVWRNAVTIARTEPSDLFIVEAGALLHDIADHKFHDGDDSAGVVKARKFLESLSVPESAINHIEKIILNISFKGGNFTQKFYSPELAIVQDADRLDAMGAIGIARTFNYGGFKGRELYNPAIPPATGMTAAQYQASTAPTVNHFYEKLLLLKDRMNTETGRKMAEERHRFMEDYLIQFFREWGTD